MQASLFGLMLALSISTGAAAMGMTSGRSWSRPASSGWASPTLLRPPRFSLPRTPLATFMAWPATSVSRWQKALDVPVEIVVAATTGELTDACTSGAIDIGFMPADEERRNRVDFSQPYFVIESTYLAAGSSDIKTLAEVDRPEITVVGIAGSTTMRAAGRSLKAAKVVPAKSVDEAMAMMRAGSAQAFALTHDALPPLQKQLPGSRILDGAFQTTGVAIAVQKYRPAALAYIKDFIESAKANGIVRRAFDDAGLNQLPIAP